MNVGRIEVGPTVVGLIMAGAGVLFLAEPFVDPIPVGDVRIPVAALSFVALAVLAGRPLAAYLTAALGGAGAALVGFESGRKRAD